MHDGDVALQHAGPTIGAAGTSPAGALSTGLRDVLANAAAFPVKNVLTLAVWAVLGIALAARFFRWE